MADKPFNEVGDMSRGAWDTLTGSGPTYSYCDRVKKLEQQLQEKDREIAELKESIEIRSAVIKRLSDRMDRNDNIVRDLQEFESKFMDFKSRCSCSYFFSYWPWSE